MRSENVRKKVWKERNEWRKQQQHQWTNQTLSQNQSVNIANLVWKAHTHSARMRRFGRKYLKRKLLSLDRTIYQRQTNKQKKLIPPTTSSVAINTQHELQLYYLILLWLTWDTTFICMNRIDSISIFNTLFCLVAKTFLVLFLSFSWAPPS